VNGALSEGSLVQDTSLFSQIVATLVNHQTEAAHNRESILQKEFRRVARAKPLPIRGERLRSVAKLKSGQVGVETTLI
jgi:hypothetical protein